MLFKITKLPQKNEVVRNSVTVFYFIRLLMYFVMEHVYSLSQISA